MRFYLQFCYSISILQKSWSKILWFLLRFNDLWFYYSLLTRSKILTLTSLNSTIVSWFQVFSLHYYLEYITITNYGRPLKKKNYWRIIMHRNMSMRIHAIDFLHDWSSVWTVCKMQYWRRFSTSNDQVWIDIIV